MAKAVSAIPPGHHTLTPYLVVRDAVKAIDFYKAAFGATEHGRMPTPDGRIGHAELKIGDSFLFLADEFPEMGNRSPLSLGGSTVCLHLYVEDVDAVYAQAIKAGATAKMPPGDMFWGDRYGKLTDPFGHEWGISTHKEDLTHEEVEARGREAMANTSADGGGK